MLTLEECRKILEPDCYLSDSEIELIRRDLYVLADMIVDLFMEQDQQNMRKSSA